MKVSWLEIEGYMRSTYIECGECGERRKASSSEPRPTIQPEASSQTSASRRYVLLVVIFAALLLRYCAQLPGSVL
jgi:hypothetical protein